MFNLGKHSSQNSEVRAEKINPVEDQKQTITVDSYSKRPDVTHSLVNRIQKLQILIQAENKKTEINLPDIENKVFSLSLSGTAFLMFLQYQKTQS